MSSKLSTADALANFDAAHGHVVTNALNIYAEDMRKTASEAEAASRQPERPAAPPHASQDGTTTVNIQPTPAGYAGMAQLFREAADRADRAREAYEALTDDDDISD